jgi:hypothetical protein
MRLVAPHLAPWVEMWRGARPSFRPESLRFAGTRVFEPTFSQPVIVSEGPPPERDPFRVPSPGGAYTLVIDIYQYVGETETGVEIGGEPDSAPALIDERSKGMEILAQCGTPCGFHWGAWIDSTRFVVGGWAETDSRAGGYYGTLGYYDIRRRVAADYLVPEVDPGAFAKYRDAWRKDVVARYRSLKKGPA